MESSANKREGYVMKEYNMEASTRPSKANRRFAHDLETTGASDKRGGSQSAIGTWIDWIFQDSQGRKGIIGIDRKSCFG
jgi:hypothetical protein